jgi:phosphopantothenoylcysteine decarboxylase/phosphopantothenate--cysteine ligase
LPERGRVINVLTADEMHQAVMQQIGETDIFIAAAAVADYRIDNIAAEKIKKTDDELQLILKKNPDILAAVAASENAPFTVGFAAETENLEKNALKKLAAKQIDMIAANRVGEQLGFDADENALDVYWANGKHEFQQTHKNKLARYLIALVAERYYEKHTNQTH